MSYQTFNPLDYGFVWVSVDEYQFDHVAAHKAARKARDAEAARLRSVGHTVKCGYVEDSIEFRGGEGTGHPEIEKVVTIYDLRVR